MLFLDVLNCTCLIKIYKRLHRPNSINCALLCAATEIHYQGSGFTSHLSCLSSYVNVELYSVPMQSNQNKIYVDIKRQ